MICAMSSQGPERPDLVLLHQARIACHVSREDGCQPPLDLVLLPIHGTLGAVPGRLCRWVDAVSRPSYNASVKLPRQDGSACGIPLFVWISGPKRRIIAAVDRCPNLT